jgi:hypothetical protein
MVAGLPSVAAAASNASAVAPIRGGSYSVSGVDPSYVSSGCGVRGPRLTAFAEGYRTDSNEATRPGSFGTPTGNAAREDC